VVAEDSRALNRIRCSLGHRKICPYRLARPLAPSIAWKGQVWRIRHRSSAGAGFEEISAQHDIPYVEGSRLLNGAAPADL